VEYLIQACEAVAEAHGLGIVHRDLKPANLFLTRRLNGAPLVKVLDFGISKVINLSPTDPSLTKTSDVVGSPYYMAPEQVRSARDGDARTDIWALGVILYELLAGRVPFVATNVPQLCAKLLEEEPTPLIEVRSDVPPELSLVVSTCLRKRPEERFASVQDLVRAIAPFASIGVDGSARPRSWSDVATVNVPPLPVRSSLTLGQTLQHDSRTGPGHSYAAVLVHDGGAITGQATNSFGKGRSWLLWAAPLAGLFALVSLVGAFWLVYATVIAARSGASSSASSWVESSVPAIPPALPITGADAGADADVADVGVEATSEESAAATAGPRERPPKGQPAPTKTAVPSSTTATPAQTATTKTVDDFMPSDRK
jgi:serine/threonine-protein kinase